ncbi:MAG: hypothetical protein AB7H90_17625 [Alphaproteobacteria bacterium]
MGRFLFSLVALLAAVAPETARSQTVSVPGPPGYAVNRAASDSPLQQQMLRNYRTDLQQRQRELSVQNPSGLSREQLDVMHRLNAVNSALTPAPASPAPLPGMPEPVPVPVR